MRSQTFKILTGQQFEIANAIVERRLADLEAYKTRPADIEAPKSLMSGGAS